MPGMLVFPLLFLIASSAATSGSSTDSVSFLELVKAFLFQNTIVRDDGEYTAALFADPERNGLKMLQLPDDRTASLVRSAVAKDFAEHKTEYRVRAQVAQAKASRLGAAGSIYQEMLWNEFLNDPRYVCRIEKALRETH